MIRTDELKFDKDGLIPAVVIDVFSREVLTLAYMNRESLRISLEKRKTCFWSRSRRELWLKGETSGNYQHIVWIKADCDRDALVIAVNKEGPACHLGTESCFNDFLFDTGHDGDFSFEDLYDLLIDRKEHRPEDSYTTYLFDSGIDKILKKIGEESAEVIIGGKGGEKKETVYEIADLAYHVMVLMAEMGITPEDVREELSSRKIIDHKEKQKSMKK